MKRIKGYIYAGMVLLCSLCCTACAQKDAYGVFIGLDAQQTDKLYAYDTVVLDAQYYDAEDIAQLHAEGVTVYTYLNIGSLENFRTYYTQFQDLQLGAYANWEEEQWIDVSSPRWQSFVHEEARGLLEKGVDGFFIDNCDVYYEYETSDIFDGLTAILQDIMSLDAPVIINGGDAYVSAYRLRYGSAGDVMTGVNQESVFSAIDFENRTFSAKDEEESRYFQDYVEACAADGMQVYLLEYTTDAQLARRIAEYCDQHGFSYYISDSLELD